MGLSRSGLYNALHIVAQASDAAQPSGWRDDDFIVTLHCSGSFVAVAAQQHAAVFRANGPLAERDISNINPAFVSTICGAGERVTAATWAAFDGEDEEHSCLVVGTSAGWLQLHAVNGTMLCRQQLHDTAVLKLQLRTGGMGVNPEDASADVTVMFADAAVRISGLEIRSLMRLQQISWTDPQRLEPLSFVKWDLQKVAGLRTDGVCIGMRPVTLQTLMRGGATAAPKLTVATSGTRPPFASFEVEEQTSKGAIAMVTDLASSLKGWIPSPMRRTKEAKVQAAEAAAVGAELQDDSTRSLTSLQLAPRGPLAAATDTLGRVMLIDLAAMAIVRLLKGYRDAQCAWLLLPVDHFSAQTSQSSSALPQPDATAPASKPPSQTTAGSSLRMEVYLVIYAPKRGVCDIYSSRHSRPLCSQQCGRNGRLLQPIPNMSPSHNRRDASVRDCLLLDFDNGSLTSVHQILRGRVR